MKIKRTVMLSALVAAVIGSLLAATPGRAERLVAGSAARDMQSVSRSAKAQKPWRPARPATQAPDFSMAGPAHSARQRREHPAELPDAADDAPRLETWSLLAVIASLLLLLARRLRSD